jgi:pilus assembly protein Flp/PilA
MLVKAKSLITRFRKDEDGAALIEYTVLLGILVVAVIASIGVVGTWVAGKWSTLSGTLVP